jgi:hypothetical protein
VSCPDLQEDAVIVVLCHIHLRELSMHRVRQTEGKQTDRALAFMAG